MTYSPEEREKIMDTICDEMVALKPMRKILADHPDFPAWSTVFKWLGESPRFSDQYARAREAQMEARMDEVLEIADDGTNDVEEIEENGRVVRRTNHDVIQRSRLRVDTRIRLAEKMSPKKYGARMDVTVTKTLSELSPEEKWMEAVELARKLELPEPPRASFGLPALVRLQ